MRHIEDANAMLQRVVRPSLLRMGLSSAAWFLGAWLFGLEARWILTCIAGLLGLAMAAMPILASVRVSGDRVTARFGRGRVDAASDQVKVQRRSIGIALATQHFVLAGGEREVALPLWLFSDRDQDYLAGLDQRPCP